MVFDFSVFRLSEPCRAVVDTGDNDNDRMKRHGMTQKKTKKCTHTKTKTETKTLKIVDKKN